MLIKDIFYYLSTLSDEQMKAFLNFIGLFSFFVPVLYQLIFHLERIYFKLLYYLYCFIRKIVYEILEHKNKNKKGSEK